MAATVATRSYASVIRSSPKKMRKEEPVTPVPTTPSVDMADHTIRPYLNLLRDALQLEMKYHGAAQPVKASGKNVITSGMRDGSAHVLRCLKVWYDLPSEILFTAVLNIDRFLAKMKVTIFALLLFLRV